MFEFRGSVVDAMKILLDVGISHDNLESAAHHISEFWSDVEGWWQLDAVQTARNEFSEHYARRPADLLTEIEMALLGLDRQDYKMSTLIPSQSE